MTNGKAAVDVAVSTLVSSEMVSADIRDVRSETVTMFQGLSGQQREEVVRDAWVIGLRALGNAHTAAQEARLADVGASLLAELDARLRTHVEQQHATIGAVLGRFFDPRDGHVTQRLAAFVDDHGVLARLLEKNLGPQNSVLADALSRQVGETSPLLKRLSPTDSSGLIPALESQLQRVLEQSHGQMVHALDPLAEDGAVARFLSCLREEIKGADQDRQKQISAALAARDANDETALINRLVRETERARQAVLSAVNPDVPTSPMAIVLSRMMNEFRDGATVQAEVARRQEERQIRLETDVRVALERFETRRELQQQGTRAGLDFEEAVVSFVAAATRSAPCIFDFTGATAGVGRCKKGDAGLRFTSDSAYAGAGVVFEAMRDSTYTVQRALDELDAARKNRDAVAGVFVMARSHAGESFSRFARHGSCVIVTWDQEDPPTDACLHAAILLGMALVSRAKTTGDAGDIAALRDIEARIENELARLERMEKHSDTIRRHVDGLAEEIRKGHKALSVLVKNAQSTLRALKVELHDEEAERGSPILLPEPSLDEAEKAITPEAAPSVVPEWDDAAEWTAG